MKIDYLVVPLYIFLFGVTTGYVLKALEVMK